MDRERDRDPGRGTHTQREEVFERIPWETLERPARDNNRMVIAVAGALVLGALGFSFVRNQPVSQPVVAPPTTIPSQSSPATVQPPVLRSEADLYAVDPDQIARHAASHAEWFVVEYLSFDDAATLERLLPVGVPAPRAPEGTRVYVDWVSAVSVSDIGGLVYEVEVLARSMAAAPGEGFTRQAPVKVVVDVLVGPDGLPRVLRPPRFVDPVDATPAMLGLTPLPDSLRDEVQAIYGEVVGGEQLADGRWRVVVMVTDPDGVSRPRTVVVP